MSKAFTRELDDAPERVALPRPSASLPPGAKNYMTPQGAHRMRAELENLAEERLRLLGGPSEEKTAQLPLLDQRIYLLRQNLESAEVVNPPTGAPDRVLFGATVTVRERNGGVSTYRIVGVDETDLDQDWVSWISPIAKALLNTKLGQRVRFKFPSGEKELEIAGISYE
ncbi:MAG TPA: GreA/GreB family elongation factor [Candidatus Saccharimonadales bacterium]|nr:GreA/GreB family elongation factor [Candidatus Saccharimonadales bacterium]